MKNINNYLELTNLDYSATHKDVKQLIRDAIKYQVAGICISPPWIDYVKTKLKNVSIKTITVPNWRPNGGLINIPNSILDLCEEADEVDYVVNAYEMYSLQEWDTIEENLKEIQRRYKTKKLIIEASYIHAIPDLAKDKKRLFKNVLRFVDKYKFDFVKTDSGIIKRKSIDTLYDDVTLLKRIIKLPIKTAGGIRTYEQCVKLISLGVERIGISKYEGVLNARRMEI